MNLCAAFASYRSEFPTREPDWSRVNDEDELRKLSEEDGIQYFTTPPIMNTLTGFPPNSFEEESPKRYLWVVSSEEIPFALEQLSGVVFKRGKLSHTNITGGEAAHCGGELWFVGDDSLILNGASGRYLPRSKEELEAVALSFKQAGFKVASMGWDNEAGPVRLMRGEPNWL